MKTNTWLAFVVTLVLTSISLTVSSQAAQALPRLVDDSPINQPSGVTDSGDNSGPRDEGLSPDDPSLRGYTRFASDFTGDIPGPGRTILSRDPVSRNPDAHFGFQLDWRYIRVMPLDTFLAHARNGEREDDEYDDDFKTQVLKARLHRRQLVGVDIRTWTVVVDMHCRNRLKRRVHTFINSEHRFVGGGQQQSVQHCRCRQPRHPGRCMKGGGQGYGRHGGHMGGRQMYRHQGGGVDPRRIAQMLMRRAQQMQRAQEMQRRQHMQRAQQMHRQQEMRRFEEMRRQRMRHFG